MTAILDLSARIIDSGDVTTRSNRISNELSPVADGVWIIESFSHVILVETDDGLVAFDSSSANFGPKVVAALREWTDEPVNTLVYTHGHVDHTGGSRSFAADAEANGHRRPRVVGHRNLARRHDRYHQTNGYNQTINLRQFGGLPTELSAEKLSRPFVVDGTMEVTVDYEDHFVDDIGGLRFEHHHALGETDDHTWTWIPELKTITAGDHLTWVFPNCGNPQKVQRYPLEWARSLRAMAACRPELLVPAHGLPIGGRQRIAGVLDTVAGVLEGLVDDVIAAMNSGARLADIVNSVGVDEQVLALPYLRPVYDEPEFVIRNIWRLYGGWWDGDPASLKPPGRNELAAAVADLAGGADIVADRAAESAAAGDLRLACQLIEYAVTADPTSSRNHEIRDTIYTRRRKAETSLMAKGIYGATAAESELVHRGEATVKPTRISLGESDDPSD